MPSRLFSLEELSSRRRYILTGGWSLDCGGLANQMWRFASLYGIGKPYGRQPISTRDQQCRIERGIIEMFFLNWNIEIEILKLEGCFLYFFLYNENFIYFFIIVLYPHQVLMKWRRMRTLAYYFQCTANRTNTL